MKKGKKKRKKNCWVRNLQQKKGLEYHPPIPNAIHSLSCGTSRHSFIHFKTQSNNVTHTDPRIQKTQKVKRSKHNTKKHITNQQSISKLALISPPLFVTCLSK